MMSIAKINELWLEFVAKMAIYTNVFSAVVIDDIDINEDYAEMCLKDYLDVRDRLVDALADIFLLDAWAQYEYLGENYVNDGYQEFSNREEAKKYLELLFAETEHDPAEINTDVISIGDYLLVLQVVRQSIIDCGRRRYLVTFREVLRKKREDIDRVDED